MAENGPKFQYFSLEKGVQVPQLMFLGQTYLVLISWNKIYLMEAAGEGGGLGVTKNPPNFPHELKL